MAQLTPVGSANSTSSARIWALLLVSALGYFVDVYDLIILSVVRRASLQGLGVPESAMLDVGIDLLNIQVAGVLIGGLVWGVLGDKRGRLTVLFGSIVLYSIANILNASVTSVEQYKVLRFIAGFGLAGELGAAVTIVSEVVSKERRGLATMGIASLGLLGAIAASEVGIHFGWRNSYLIGGVLGLCLLALRIGTFESALFIKTRSLDVERGNILMLVRSAARLRRYLLCILAGAPLYFVIGILITASPEFGRAEGLQTMPVAAVAVIWAYGAMSAGDIACSTLSQWFRSRRIALGVFHVLCLVFCVVYILVPSPTVQIFYAKCGALGFAIGFWAVLNSNAAEQFGTNLRASVATSVPNFVRALLIPISFGFNALKNVVGLSQAALIVGGTVCIIALAHDLASRRDFRKGFGFYGRRG